MKRDAFKRGYIKSHVCWCPDCRWHNPFMKRWMHHRARRYMKKEDSGWLS